MTGSTDTSQQPAVPMLSYEDRPEDSPAGSLYVAADLEGHRWMFLQPD
jgi:hypothetical protein